MATEDATLNTKRGAGIPARVRVSKLISLTVNGNTTVKDSSVVVPAGSYYRAHTIDTPTAISGTPTTCNVRIGTADAGQQILADVDAKAQGHITGTVVAALDKVGGFASADTTLFAQVVTSGGTSSAGKIYILVDYDAPNY